MVIYPTIYCTIHIFNVTLPDRSLINIELSTYARELEIPHFRGVFMRDTSPQYPFNIVNLNTSDQSGSHWVCYYRNGSHIYYIDSYRQITPVEIQRYLNTGIEFKHGSEVIPRNTANTSVCCHLCLFVLKSLTNGKKFQSILNHMRHYGYT